MNKGGHISVLCLIVCGVLGCTQHHDAPIPRQYAYARPYDYASQPRDTAQLGPISLSIPQGAEATTADGPKGSQWLTVVYPRWGAEAHYTLTPVNASTRNAVIANRRQRMTLNAGDIPTNTEPLTSPWPGALITAQVPSPLPVQWLSPGQGYVLSGAAFMPGVTHDAPADSLMPVINLLASDIHTTITSCTLSR